MFIPTDEYLDEVKAATDAAENEEGACGDEYICSLYTTIGELTGHIDNLELGCRNLKGQVAALERDLAAAKAEGDGVKRELEKIVMFAGGSENYNDPHKCLGIIKDKLVRNGDLLVKKTRDLAAAREALKEAHKAAESTKELTDWIADLRLCAIVTTAEDRASIALTLAEKVLWPAAK